MSEFDVIEAEEDEEAALGPNPLLPQPVVIKGSGNVTVFGVSSRFEAGFPRELTGKVAPEEFKATMSRVNGVVRKSMPVNVRWLFCGCLLCCCTLGCSLWPVLCLSRRTIKALDKALDWENHQLYNKLGLHWRLARRTCDSSNLAEYVHFLNLASYWGGTIKALDKALDWENHQLYNKLGLHWRLARRTCDSSNLAEYVHFLNLASNWGGTIKALDKALDWENHQLYNKLGLHWRLARRTCDSSNLAEYVHFLNLASYWGGTIKALDKALDWENHQLYNKLGLHWRLARRTCDSSNLAEYVHFLNLASYWGGTIKALDKALDWENHQLYNKLGLHWRLARRTCDSSNLAEYVHFLNLASYWGGTIKALDKALDWENHQLYNKLGLHWRLARRTCDSSNLAEYVHFLNLASYWGGTIKALDKALDWENHQLYNKLGLHWRLARRTCDSSNLAEYVHFLNLASYWGGTIKALDKALDWENHQLYNKLGLHWRLARRTCDSSNLAEYVHFLNLASYWGGTIKALDKALDWENHQLYNKLGLHWRLARRTCDSSNLAEYVHFLNLASYWGGTIKALDKALDWENHQLYNKLGLHWRLARRTCDSSNLAEYVHFLNLASYWGGTIKALDKALDWENHQLYNKLGLHWRLARRTCDSSNLAEYVHFLNLASYWGGTIKALDKALDWENHQLYNKLGLHWRLARRTCDSSNLAEYVHFLNLASYWGGTIKALDKALDWENHQLYNKLGLHWRLARRTCDSSNLAEYVHFLNLASYWD